MRRIDTFWGINWLFLELFSKKLFVIKRLKNNIFLNLIRIYPFTVIYSLK